MREFRGTPFCWQSKTATRLIRSHFKDTRTRCSARAIYQTLTEYASDKNSDKFSEYFVVVADSAGMSLPTFSSIMRGLSQLGVVRYSRGRYGGSKYEMAVFELLDLEEGDMTESHFKKTTESLPEKPKKADKKEEKPEQVKDGKVEIPENVVSISQVVDRLNNEEAKKTLGKDEYIRIIEGLKNFGKGEQKELAKVFNKNQLGNLIFEGWVGIAGIKFIEPIAKDRSRHYKRCVRPIQDIVQYLISSKGELLINDIFEKMVAWANTGLSWEISTVLKHIEKSPKEIIDMCTSAGGKGKDIVPPKHLTGRKYKSDIIA